MNQDKHSSPLSDVDVRTENQGEMTLQQVVDSSVVYMDKEDEEIINIPKKVLLNLLAQIEDLDSTVTELENELETIRSNIHDIDQEQEYQTNRMDVFYDLIEENSQTRSDLEERIESLENQIDSSTETTTTTPDEPPTENSSLEHLAAYPEEQLSDICSQTVRRAVIVYKRFDKWSESVIAGRRLKSSQLKTLLNEVDSDIKWATQVHRVMEEFDDRTDESYYMKETNTLGKALIKEEN